MIKRPWPIGFVPTKAEDRKDVCVCWGVSALKVDTRGHKSQVSALQGPSVSWLDWHPQYILRHPLNNMLLLTYSNSLVLFIISSTICWKHCGVLENFVSFSFPPFGYWWPLELKDDEVKSWWNQHTYTTPLYFPNPYPPTLFHVHGIKP